MERGQQKSYTCNLCVLCPYARAPLVDVKMHPFYVINYNYENNSYQ